MTVANTGKTNADEVIELYITHPHAGNDAPIYALKNFKRISLQAGASKKVNFKITPEMLTLINDAGEAVFVNGDVTIYIGGSLPSERSKTLGAADYVSKNILCK